MRKIKQSIEITTTGQFQKIFLDIVGPLPKTHSNNINILTMQDDLTKYSVAVAIPEATANTVT